MPHRRRRRCRHSSDLSSSTSTTTTTTKKKPYQLSAPPASRSPSTEGRTRRGFCTCFEPRWREGDEAEEQRRRSRRERGQRRRKPRRRNLLFFRRRRPRRRPLLHFRARRRLPRNLPVRLRGGQAARAQAREENEPRGRNHRERLQGPALGPLLLPRTNGRRRDRSRDEAWRPECRRTRRALCLSPGWPPFLRVNPVLEWGYSDVWGFLDAIGASYCSLYDRGFTSVGGGPFDEPEPRSAEARRQLCPREGAFRREDGEGWQRERWRWGWRWKWKEEGKRNKRKRKQQKKKKQKKKRSFPLILLASPPQPLPLLLRFLPARPLCRHRPGRRRAPLGEGPGRQRPLALPQAPRGRVAAPQAQRRSGRHRGDRLRGLGRGPRAPRGACRGRSGPHGRRRDRRRGRRGAAGSPGPRRRLGREAAGLFR